MNIILLTEIFSGGMDEEDSKASKQAKQMGLTSKGWGRWADASGNITHKTDNGKLVPVSGGGGGGDKPPPSKKAPSAGDGDSPEKKGGPDISDMPPGTQTTTSELEPGAEFIDVDSLKTVTRQDKHGGSSTQTRDQANAEMELRKSKNWWRIPPEKVMSLAYHAKGQLPPSDPQKKKENWERIKAQLIQKAPPPEGHPYHNQTDRPTTGGDKPYSSLGIGADDEMPVKKGAKLDPDTGKGGDDYWDKRAKVTKRFRDALPKTGEGPTLDTSTADGIKSGLVVALRRNDNDALNKIADAVRDNPELGDEVENKLTQVVNQLGVRTGNKADDQWRIKMAVQANDARAMLRKLRGQPVVKGATKPKMVGGRSTNRAVGYDRKRGSKKPR